MTLKTPQPLLRVPPFPGMKCHSMAVRSEDGQDGGLSSDSLEKLIADIRHARVGGTFWGRQPELPPSYVLVRCAEDGETGPLANVQVVQWTEGGVATSKRCDRLIVTGTCDQWHMVQGATLVIARADDELLLIASIAGVPVRCVGEGRFSALGSAEGGHSALTRVFRQEVARGFEYRNPFTGEPIGLGDAIALCAFWRSLIDSNREIVAAIGFASWKRATVARLLWGGDRSVQFLSRPPAGKAGPVAVWRSRASAAALGDLQAAGVTIVEVEDGFIRSAGLGADCIPPLSIAADRTGIYFDPSQSSDLEHLIEGGSFSQELIERARKLRSLIVERGVSKYSVGGADLTRRNPDRRHILVPGQVEDDRAVVSGLGPPTNLELLLRVRADAPDAYIIYKPHPDVEAGHRVGRIDDKLCLEIADEVVRDQPITPLIALVDEVHVNTSLAGFEALLRDKRVVTYGVPFYAGWGLTEDYGPIPGRRSARRSLDELVAATLLVYPRYLDPITNLPCPPEILISRLSEGTAAAGGMLVKLRRAQGAVRRRLANLLAPRLG